MADKKKFFHFRYLFYSFLAFLFGIAMARRLFGGEILAIIVVIAIFVIFAVSLIICKRYKSLLIVLVFFLIGNGFYFIGSLQASAKYYEGESFVIGRVTDDVQLNYSNYYSLILEDVYINGESAKNIKLNIKIDDKNEIKAGDKLTFTTSLENVKLFNLGTFNSYYIRNNIGYTASTSTSNVEIIGNHLMFDEAFRLKVKALLNQNMSEENAGICYAVLFGDKSGIDKDTKAYYQDSGIIHLLTVSGLHVGFLIALIYFVLRKLKLGRIATTIVTTIILIFFNIICGFAPSVMRASLMAIIMMSAKLLGREYDPLNSLGLAGFIILFIKPFYAFDLGFLMSFSCVAAIFMLLNPISKLLKKVMPNKLAEYLAITFSAQIGILPFMSMFAENVNLLSFFANLIIVPIFSLLYPALMLVMMVLLIIPAIAKVLLVFDLAFDFTTLVAKFFAGSVMKVPLYAFDIVFIIFLFLIMFLASHFTIMTKISKFISASVMTSLLIISVIIQVVPQKSSTSFRMLSDYNMDAVMVSTQSGQRALVYDEINSGTLSNYFYNNKIKNIDYVFLKELPSEADIDFLTSYNVKGWIVLNGEGTSDIVKAEINLPMQAGDFAVEYVVQHNLFLGFQINFDLARIFVASFTLVSYNEINILNNYLFYKDFDLVYYNGFVSYKTQGYIDEATYKKNGNLNFEFKEDGCQIWGMD